MISLIMLADKPSADASGGHVYFSSAIASGYTEMFIAISSGEHPRIYPKTGHTLVEKVQTQYNDDGDMKDEKVSVLGASWYFCKPKTP